MKTSTEPELAEIRRIRQQIIEECGRDVNKLHAYYEGLTAKRLTAKKKARPRASRRSNK